ncbi:sensor histidine kinase [Actinomadura rugatobispora]|uniref:Sensor histidine kinase n=1 Tax=Actinomadura rugatobispora TaxID=1994 RepID=A0ABW1AA63_9ACTN|nr:hypothetical protein GCM10010200_074350 [Actinomadura rugatobispora]
MGAATTAELEERAAGRLESYRRIIYRTFLLTVVGVLIPAGMALSQSYDDIGLPLTVAAAGGTAVFIWHYARVVRLGLAGRLPNRDLVAGGAVTFLLSLMMITHPMWCLVPVFWVSTVTLWVRGRSRKIAFCLGSAAVAALIASLYGEWHWYRPFFLFALFAALFWGTFYVNRYYQRMWDLHQEADAAREAQARLAVTEERLRFSRDLHDLLGHSLSLIAVKSELAMRMAEADPARARDEMADVRHAAREALREVRAAVRGYRAVELDAELAGVRAVLEAAGVRCEIGDPPADLPPEVRSVLAWVIREGATNVIKHSEAGRCAVTIAPYGDSVVLEMSNDGARPSRRAPGSGLAGLAERVEVLGGTLTAGHRDRDGFLLRAVVPIGEP